MLFRLEISYPWHPHLSESGRELDASTVEEAAQAFEGAAEVAATYTLAEIVEDLATKGRVEFEDPESGRTVVVRQVEAEALA